jgi:branched-chain amino acid transport system permease protein
MAKSGRSRLLRVIGPAVVIVLIAVAPLILKGNYYVSMGNQMGLYTIAAMGLCLLMGYAGQVSMGQAAFFGVGAYSCAILTVTYHVNPWLAIVIGAVFAAILAVIVGMPLLRLEGHVLAVATLGVSIVMYTLFVQLRGLTGGYDGIGGIPSPSILGFKFNSDLRSFYLIWVIALVVFIVSQNIVRSRGGRALRSIHQFFGGNVSAAETLGVSPHRYKVQVFVLSAVFAAIAGGLYAYWVGFINPEPFNITISILLLIIVTIGGMGSLWGALIGSIVIVLSGELFRSVLPKIIPLPGAVGQTEIIAYGLLLIVILLVLPRGLVSAGAPIKGWVTRAFHRRKSGSESQGSAAAPEEV